MAKEKNILVQAVRDAKKSNLDEVGQNEPAGMGEASIHVHGKGSFVFQRPGTKESGLARMNHQEALERIQTIRDDYQRFASYYSSMSSRIAPLDERKNNYREMNRLYEKYRNPAMIFLINELRKSFPYLRKVR